tara:strand:+ start:3649 stop:3813 length:165 start_codon:yes stop_codon:yes gene_type:complete
MYRDDFVEIKGTINGEYKTISSFDLMLKSQFNIKDTKDIDNIDIEVNIDTLKTF